jgi:addiction module RelE/StbE family toxin
MKIGYHPNFIRQFNKLSPSLQEEVLLKIEKFEKNPKDASLKNHKLHGKMSKQRAFSINYSHRIVFRIHNKKEFQFLEIGDHDIYK